MPRHPNITPAREVIKRVYRSWRFSDQKVTVAEATALALYDAGLLTNDPVGDIDLEAISVDRLLKKYNPAWAAKEET